MAANDVLDGEPTAPKEIHDVAAQQVVLNLNRVTQIVEFRWEFKNCRLTIELLRPCPMNGLLIS